MIEMKANEVLDAKGLACPMPIVKTKKAMNDLAEGKILEIQATDKGSKADLKAWAERTGNQYLGTIEEAGVLKHYLRKSANDEILEKKFPNVATNEDLEKKLANNEKVAVLDVRESVEYGFNHIPNAISIPLGELEDRLNEINKEDEIFIICRSGSRSDMAAQMLFEKGYTKVVNVLPGMCQWTGVTTSIFK